MDRKYCVLAYSTFSEASKRLIEYIQGLPYDLPRVTGLTFLNVDSASIRKTVVDAGIESVPTLLVTYFNGTNHKFEGEEIYAWIQAINSVVRGSSNRLKSEEEKSIANKEDETDDTTSRSHIVGPPPPIVLLEPQPIAEKEPATGGKLSLAAVALNMQKEREKDEPKNPFSKKD